MDWRESKIQIQKKGWKNTKGVLSQWHREKIKQIKSNKGSTNCKEELLRNACLFKVSEF